WGNRVVGGEALTAAAWRTDVAWGAGGVVDASSGGTNIVWSAECGGADCANVVWGAAAPGDAIVWGTSEDGEGDTIVWGTADAAEAVLGSAPAIRRPKRGAAAVDAGLT